MKPLLSIVFLLNICLVFAQEKKADVPQLNEQNGLAPQSQNANDPLEQSIESDSSMLYPYLERALQRLEGGYYKGALADYTSAIAINDKDSEVWLNRGLVKEKMNDLKGAYADFNKAIELKVNYHQAWFCRANVLTKLSQFKEAIDDYTVVLTYSPDYAAAFYNRAIAYYKLKRLTEACNDLRKAESLGSIVDDKIKTKLCTP